MRTEWSPARSAASFTRRLPLSLTTPMLLSVNVPVAPPRIFSCSFSFLEMTVPESPLNFRPSSKVATSCVTGVSPSLVS
ncbi:MAG TPA: hypothetical protein DCY37_00465 [Acidaminococcaceae bacterium]|nr:hypothetical protein [Acidaminococcaceae bacterium]